MREAIRGHQHAIAHLPGVRDQTHRLVRVAIERHLHEAHHLVVRRVREVARRAGLRCLAQREEQHPGQRSAVRRTDDSALNGLGAGRDDAQLILVVGSDHMRLGVLRARGHVHASGRHARLLDLGGVAQLDASLDGRARQVVLDQRAVLAAREEARRAVRALAELQPRDRLVVAAVLAHKDPLLLGGRLIARVAEPIDSHTIVCVRRREVG